MVIVMVFIYLIGIFSLFSLNAASTTAHRADQAYTRGDYAEARRLYEEAAVRHPNTLSLLYNVGKAAYKAKDYASAQAAFEKVAHSPAASTLLKEQSFFNRGDSLAQSKQYEKAIAAYTEVLKINKTNEHAKKRIELMKQLLEQQKQEDKQQQKKDNQEQQNKQNQKENQSQDQKNNQGSAPQQSDKQKQGDTSPKQTPGNEPEKREKQRNDQNKGQQKQAQNEDKQPKSDEQAGKNKRTDGRDQSEREKNDEQQQKQDSGKDSKKQQEQHTKPQKLSVAPEKSVPEKELNDQDRQNLRIIETHDKNAYRFFMKPQGGDVTTQGKNW